MIHPICSRFGLAVLASLSLFSSASAVVSIDYVSIGNAGNAADSTGYGAVAYEYKIAKNETTIGQYAEFLNAVAKSDPYALYSNAINGNTIGVAGSANFFDGDFVGYPGMALTDAGAYGANSDSFYGTNDQGGNVWEWNDAVISGSSRGLRGGAWIINGSVAFNLRSSTRLPNGPTSESDYIGFRVASVPEPSCLVLTILASGMFVTRRKRG